MLGGDCEHYENNKNRHHNNQLFGIVRLCHCDSHHGHFRGFHCWRTKRSMWRNHWLHHPTLTSSGKQVVNPIQICAISSSSTIQTWSVNRAAIAGVFPPSDLWTRQKLNTATNRATAWR